MWTQFELVGSRSTRLHISQRGFIYFILSFWPHRLFVAVCGPSLVVESGGYFLDAVHGLLIAGASLLAEGSSALGLSSGSRACMGFSSCGFRL